jgi:hypothetical protein
MIRSLGASPLEGINVVLVGPLLVPTKVGCYKKKKTGPSLVSGLLPHHFTRTPAMMPSAMCDTAKWTLTRC